MATLFVTYPGNADTRFDRDYFDTTHLPLVRQAWEPHGLETVAAFFPANDGAGTIAVAVCEFRDEAAITAALASAQTQGVMADIEKYTDAKPAQNRGVLL